MKFRMKIVTLITFQISVHRINFVKAVSTWRLLLIGSIKRNYSVASPSKGLT